MTVPATVDDERVLEREVPLSRSILWRLQRRYFEQRGVDAWRRGEVPHYVTSNPFIADAYARVIAGFLRDAGGAEPVDVVELGAGSGRFAFHLLRRLCEAQARGELAAPFRYVMTDFTEGPIAFWREHPSLRPFVERGVLDFARFDVERDRALTLLGSGRRIAADAPARPLVAIANYFFDGIPQDAFRVRDGRPFACLLTTHAPADADADDPTLLGRLRLSWSERAVGEGHYGEAELDALLDGYCGALADTVVRLPVAALRCCRLLDELAGGRLLLLSADKGWAYASSLLGRSEPEPVVHGSFSLPVDFHAIGEAFRRRGGGALHAPLRSSELVVSAMLSRDPAAHVATRAAFAQAVEAFGPDDFFHLKQAFRAVHHEMTLPQLMAFLRLARDDARVLAQSIDRLIALAGTADDAQRRDLSALVLAAWDNHFHLGEAQDLAFSLGVLLAELRQPRRAIAFFHRSLALHGDDANTFFNLAVCHQSLNEGAEAARWIARTLAVEPTHERALALRGG